MYVFSLLVAFACQPAPPAPPQMLATADVWRQSKARRPPWEQIDIAVGEFGVEPNIGDKVSVLPMVGLPALELEVIEVVERDELVDEGVPAWWEITLERVTDPAYATFQGPADRSALFPAAAVVVYPANPAVSLIDRASLDASTLPHGVRPQMVQAAVDIDGDDAADAILITVCSDDRRKAKCFEATAAEFYRRESGRWKLSHRFEPAT